MCADYTESAKCIDKTRLWKQVLEAWQILRVLEQAHLIAKWKGWPSCPNTVDNSQDSLTIARNYREKCTWLSTVRSTYLATDTRYVIQDGNVELRPLDHLPHKVDKYEICKCSSSNMRDQHVHVWIPNSKYNKVSTRILNIQCQYISPEFGNSKYKIRTLVILPRCYVSLGEDRVFNLGYAQHPVSAMWIGYENSLIDYIHAHHQECLRRGVNAPTLTMPIFHNSNIVPWWIRKTEAIFYTHRSSLYRKDPIHYQFLTPGIRDPQAQYIWPPHLTIEEIVSLIRPLYVIVD